MKDSGSLGRAPREPKMLKGHLLILVYLVIYDSDRNETAAELERG